MYLLLHTNLISQFIATLCCRKLNEEVPEKHFKIWSHFVQMHFDQAQINRWSWKQQDEELHGPEWNQQNHVPAKFQRTVVYFLGWLVNEGKLNDAKKYHKISTSNVYSNCNFGKFQFPFSLTSKHKAADGRNESGQKWIEWECSN